MYTMWHCTGQHCCSISIYACMYHVFAGTWRPLVSVIQCCIVCMLFQRTAHRIFNKMKVWASCSPPRPPLCLILFLSWPPLLSQLMEKNHIINQSPSLFDGPGTEALPNMILCYGLSAAKLHKRTPVMH